MANYLPMASLRVPVAKLLVIDHPIAVNSRYWFNFGCHLSKQLLKINSKQIYCHIH